MDHITLETKKQVQALKTGDVLWNENPMGGEYLGVVKIEKDNVITFSIGHQGETARKVFRAEELLNKWIVIPV